jgi:carbon-monoxide dehydrogenase medium subunit
MDEDQFFRVTSAQEACELLSRYGSKARLMAGGTDLMVWVNEREVSPEVLIYLGNSGLDYIKIEGQNLIIGAATPYTEILEADLVEEKAPLLKEAVSHLASPAIRNVGTIGGNLGTASPAADSATALLALGAGVKLVSKGSERVVSIDDFFTGPGETVCGAEEMIQEVIIPVQVQTAGWGYQKLGKRRAQSISIVSVAVYCPMQERRCHDVRIALGAVAPTPLLAKEAASRLEGNALVGQVIEDAAQAAADATDPIDDVRSTAWYRRKATQALVKKLLTEIAV